MVADEQRHHQHRAEAAGAREVRIFRARVGPEVAALHRTSLLHRASGDPLSRTQSNGRHRRRRHVEARRHHQLVRRGVDRQQAARVDAEDAPRPLQEHLDRPADIQARRDRPARLEERAGLARAPDAPFGEARPLDRQRQGARELGDHIEVGVVESSGAQSRERDRAEHGAARCQGDERHRPGAAGGQHAVARLGHRVALEVVDPHPGAGGHDAREQRPLQRHPRTARRGRRKPARRQVDELELAAHGVEQRHADRVEPHELRRALGERGEYLVERMARREQPRDPIQHGGAPRQPVTRAPALDGRPELARQARRQRRRRQASAPTEQDQFADGPARHAERRSQKRRRPAPGRARRHDPRNPRAARRCRGNRRQPAPETHGRASGTGRDDDGLLVARPDCDRAGRGAGQVHQAAQGLGEPLRHGRGDGDRRRQVVERSPPLHAGVRSRPGRLPVCSPCLMTKRPLTST